LIVKILENYKNKAQNVTAPLHSSESKILHDHNHNTCIQKHSCLVWTLQ